SHLARRRFALVDAGNGGGEQCGLNHDRTTGIWTCAGTSFSLHHVCGDVANRSACPRPDGSLALDSLILRARPTKNEGRILSPAWPIHPPGLPKLPMGFADLAGHSANAPLWKGACLVYQCRA